MQARTEDHVREENLVREHRTYYMRLAPPRFIYLSFWQITRHKKKLSLTLLHAFRIVYLIRVDVH